MVVKQIAMNVIEVALPWLKVTYRQRKLEHLFNTNFKGKDQTVAGQRLQYFVESQLILEGNDNMIMV